MLLLLLLLLYFVHIHYTRRWPFRLKYLFARRGKTYFQHNTPRQRIQKGVCVCQCGTTRTVMVIIFARRIMVRHSNGHIISYFCHSSSSQLCHLPFFILRLNGNSVMCSPLYGAWLCLFVCVCEACARCLRRDCSRVHPIRLGYPAAVRF